MGSWHRRACIRSEVGRNGKQFCRVRRCGRSGCWCIKLYNCI
jgi:hypothetical protein